MKVLFIANSKDEDRTKLKPIDLTKKVPLKQLKPGDGFIDSGHVYVIIENKLAMKIPNCHVADLCSGSEVTPVKLTINVEGFE